MPTELENPDSIRSIVTLHAQLRCEGACVKKPCSRHVDESMKKSWPVYPEGRCTCVVTPHSAVTSIVPTASGYKTQISINFKCDNCGTVRRWG